MNTLRYFDQRVVPVGHWIARILDVFLLTLVTFLFIGEALSEGLPRSITTREWLLFVAFVPIYVGLIAAWWHAALGGGLILLGILIFVIVEGFGIGWVLGLTALTGMLFVICAWRERVQGRFHRPAAGA